MDLVRNAWRSPTVWLGVALGILLIVVYQADKNRPKVVRDAQVQFCKDVTQPAAKAGIERDTDNAATQRDIAIFAQAAADARRRDGNNKTAEVYEGVVVRSDTRAARAEQRKSDTQARAAIPCEERFPVP